MSTIRLNAIAMTGFPQVRKCDASTVPSTTKVNCVLHTGRLRAHQLLEVRVNGALQTGMLEGEQFVFTWQFFNASDEVRITLLNRGVRVRHWQGCWNERGAILHTGTLHVQVMFDGKPQPVMEAMLVVPSPAPSTISSVPSSLPETVNNTNGHSGTTVDDTPVLEQAIAVDDGEGRSQTTDREGKRAAVVVQDLQVIAEAKHMQLSLPEVEIISAEDPADMRARVLEEDVYTFDGNEVDEGGQEPDEIAEAQEDNFEMREGVKDVKSEEVRGDLVAVGGQQRLAATLSQVGRRIAAFYANALAPEETLQSLKDLVAMLPPKTLLVDLRMQNHRQKKKYQEQEGLSKQLLRTVFGGKYWDRGWAIQTMLHPVPSPGSQKRMQWRYAIVNPDRYPDGIPSLVKRLEEGYSIVVMDSQATYDESRRQAVVEELQRHFSDLEIGPLS